jgi:aminoglycoside 3'-phosphotransferase II
MPLRSLLMDEVREIEVSGGMSGARVARLVTPGQPDRILKEAPVTSDGGVDAEVARLRWLATTSLSERVPRVVSFASGPPIDRLVMTALPGASATDWEGDEVDLATLFGRALRDVHVTLDPDACPFDARLACRIPMLERAVAEGLVDDTQFEAEHLGRTANDVLEQVLRERPGSEDIVVTHGDWTLDNVIVDDDGSWGFIDVGGLGLACRWYDLAIGARSIRHELDERGRADSAVDAFFDAYGVEPNDELMRYYVLVDELQ